MGLNNIESQDSGSRSPYEEMLFLEFVAKDDSVPDDVVEAVFLKTHISSEEDISRAVLILKNTRPHITQKLIRQ